MLRFVALAALCACCRAGLLSSLLPRSPPHDPPPPRPAPRPPQAAEKDRKQPKNARWHRPPSCEHPLVYYEITHSNSGSLLEALVRAAGRLNVPAVIRGGPDAAFANAAVIAGPFSPAAVAAKRGSPPGPRECVVWLRRPWARIAAAREADDRPLAALSTAEAREALREAGGADFATGFLGAGAVDAGAAAPSAAPAF